VDCLAEGATRHKVLSLFIWFKIIQVTPQITVGVGYRVSEENWVVIVGERVREGETVVLFAVVGHIFSDSVLKVRNVFAFTRPSHLFTLSSFFAVDGDLLSIVEHRVSFTVVEQIEFYSLVGWGILYPKVKPLGMTASIDIILQHEVVLWIWTLLG
jgi:hypothetical protein